MKKIFAILIIGILALTIGCVAESQPLSQDPPVTITYNSAKSSYPYEYESEKGFMVEAPQGKRFALLYFEVENKNCPKFAVRHFAFKFQGGQVQYDPYLYYGPYELKDVDLLPGGKTEGYVIFMINDETDESPYWKYEPLGSSCGVELKGK
mgnify:CR=1 FL=1